MTQLRWWTVLLPTLFGAVLLWPGLAHSQIHPWSFQVQRFQRQIPLQYSIPLLPLRLPLQPQPSLTPQWVRTYSRQHQPTFALAVRPTPSSLWTAETHRGNCAVSRRALVTYSANQPYCSPLNTWPGVRPQIPLLPRSAQPTPRFPLQPRLPQFPLRTLPQPNPPWRWSQLPPLLVQGRLPTPVSLGSPPLPGSPTLPLTAQVTSRPLLLAQPGPVPSNSVAQPAPPPVRTPAARKPQPPKLAQRPNPPLTALRTALPHPPAPNLDWLPLPGPERANPRSPDSQPLLLETLRPSLSFSSTVCDRVDQPTLPALPPTVLQHPAGESRSEEPLVLPELSEEDALVLLTQERPPVSAPTRARRIRTDPGLSMPPTVLTR